MIVLDVTRSSITLLYDFQVNTNKAWEKDDVLI